MTTGRVKWFNASESHGYIILFDGTEVYFHAEGLLSLSSIEQLTSGTDVCFDLIHTRGGMEAQNIDVIG